MPSRMIRRHLTPALVAFIALLLGCLGSPLLGGRWWLTAVLWLVLAAAGGAAPGRGRARPAGTDVRDAPGSFSSAPPPGSSSGRAPRCAWRMTLARSFLADAGKRRDRLRGHRCPGQQPLPGGRHGPAAGDERRIVFPKGYRGARAGRPSAFRGRRLPVLPRRAGPACTRGRHALEGFGPERWVARARRADVTSLGLQRSRVGIPRRGAGLAAPRGLTRGLPGLRRSLKRC